MCAEHGRRMLIELQTNRIMTTLILDMYYNTGLHSVKIQKHHSFLEDQMIKATILGEVYFRKYDLNIFNNHLNHNSYTI